MMELQRSSSSKRREEGEWNLNMREEWGLRSQISRDNTKSRRFSGSHIRSSFRELDHHQTTTRSSFRSNITSISISSTASSPGYSLREEIDPSTYSFTSALKALQAKSGYYNSWDHCLYSPDGFALNSKWNEAEKYISNPLSGEVPMECLSAKTLSGRSFRNLITNRMTMSAPLIYPSHHQIHTTKTTTTTASATEVQDDHIIHVPIRESKVEEGMKTRDVGTQSTPTHFSSGSVSPAASTPSIGDRSLKPCEADDSPNSTSEKFKAEEQVIYVEETKGGKGETKVKENCSDDIEEKEGKDSSCCGSEQIWGCGIGGGGGGRGGGGGGGGCLPWMKKRQREKHKSRRNNVFLLNLKVAHC